jgi:MinD superfamily P-loop ATPase
LSTVRIMPIYDETKCDGCGLCISVCRCGALVWNGKAISVIRADDCGWCTDCELVCETGAMQCPYEIRFAEDD